MQLEYRALWPNGAVRWIQVRGRTVEGARHRLIGVSMDVTERKADEAALRQLNETLELRIEEALRQREAAEEALRQSQKMEAIGQLTGGIAHDFNNLLTGIIGALDLIQRRIEAGRTQELDRFIDAALTSANRAAALTHRLLAFARRQPLDPKPIEVDRLVGAMEALLRSTLGEHIQLDFALEAATWRAFGDAAQLESAVLNLAINARDAMPDGGRLTIRTENLVLDPPGAQREGAEPGEYVAIQVTDTGVGMSAEVAAKAFDPFFTTKPLGQGTGLGLSMIYGFAKQSGGHARLESAPGRGATVKILLPRHLGEREAESAPMPRARNRGRGETVLLVEDDPAIRLLVGEILADLGYQTVTAEDGPAAIPILESKRRIDLMISDVGLPGLNGRGLADIARRSRPRLQVLFISGYAEDAASREGFLAEGMDLISKPFAFDRLAAKIREMLAAR